MGKVDLPTATGIERVEFTDSVRAGRKACQSDTGRLALYHLSGQIDNLPSYGHLCGDPRHDTLISRRQVLKLIQELQGTKR